MTNTTIWWQSKTVWGSGVAMAAGLLGLTASVQLEVTDILVNVGALAGGAVALYGRIVAVSQLIWSKP